ncbi:hypothetical protein Tco_0035136 [Tanacetum coccineum]
MSNVIIGEGNNDVNNNGNCDFGINCNEADKDIGLEKMEEFLALNANLNSNSNTISDNIGRVSCENIVKPIAVSHENRVEINIHPKFSINPMN